MISWEGIAIHRNVSGNVDLMKWFYIPVQWLPESEFPILPGGSHTN